MRFMGIPGPGHELVNEGDQGNPREESQCGHPGPAPRSIENRKGALGLGQDLHETDVEHDAGGESQAHRKEAGAGVASEEGNGAADAGGEAGEQGKTEGESEIGHDPILGAPDQGRAARVVWANPGSVSLGQAMLMPSKSAASWALKLERTRGPA